jgi:hypothetical protein
MPYEINWYAPERVIYERLYGEVTLEDARGLNSESYDFFHEGTPLIHVVVDLTGVQKFPASLTSIGQMIKNKPQQGVVGWVLIYGAENPLLRFIASMVAQVSGDKIRLRMMNSLEEAVNFLRQQDETLADLPLPQEDT